MSDDKYDPTGPTRRIDDWKPLSSSGVTRGAGSDTNATKPIADLSPEGPDAATRYVADPIAKAKGKDDPSAARKDPVSGEMSFMHDPAVGWLVVVKGPGRGQSLRLGLGMNTVGRGEGNRVRLDHGDNQISRDKHCIVTYEPKRRTFYIQNEGGQNLTYVGEAVVLQPQELKTGDTIAIGATELRFVPLCGPDFTWDPPSP